MNDTKLKDLFEQALAGEPVQMVPVHEDVARGRALRGRMVRRRRTAGLGLVAAAVIAGFVLPSSPVSVVDGDVAQAPSTAETIGRGVLSPEVAGDPLKRQMWAAVDKVLPPEVELVEGSFVYGDEPGPNLYLSLQRGDAWFTMSIWMQDARADLEEFRPCSTPGLPVEWKSCEEGFDDEGRWRLANRDQHSALTVLEGGPALVTVQWNPVGVEMAANGTSTPSSDPTLTSDDVDAVAQAIWSVGSQHTTAELATGIDLAATAESWADIRTSLESELGVGALMPAEPAPGASADDPVVDIENTEFQTGTVSQRYVTAGGVEVDVVVWQKDRLYEPFCLETSGECSFLPGHGRSGSGIEPAADATTAGQTGPSGVGVSAAIGQRAGMSLTIGSWSADLEDRTSVASAEAVRRVPFLGDDRFPLPDYE